MMKDKLYKKLRIFVSCPSDVDAERVRLVTVIKDDLEWLADELGITLELLDWPSVLPGAGRPEKVILDELKPKTWDVFVGIMWYRFGSPPQKSTKASAQNYFSGTEEEFKAAYRLWKRYKRPRVMFYWCKRDVAYDSIDAEQFKRVKKFFKEFLPKGGHPALYCEYKEKEDFERVVRKHLGQLLFRQTPYKVRKARSRRIPSTGSGRNAKLRHSRGKKGL